MFAGFVDPATAYVVSGTITYVGAAQSAGTGQFPDQVSLWTAAIASTAPALSTTAS
jgi:hypothetical protein